MADTGFKYPATKTTESVAPESDNDWSNIANIGAADSANASITAANFDYPDISHRAKAQGFDFSVIPDGSTIDGVLVEIERYRDLNEAGKDYRVQLLDATGALAGDNKADTATQWPTSPTIKSYGGATDTWNASPTAAMVKDADFGVVLSAQADASNADIYVDYIRITVFYTSAGVTVTPGTASLVITLYTPAVSISDNKIVTPGTLSLTITNYTPSVILGTIVTPGTVALVTTLWTPTVIVSGGGTTVTPGTASLVLTFYTPTVIVTANITVTPGTLALVTTRYTPSVILGTVIVPGTLALVITLYIPTISVSENITVTPGTASLVITTYAPSVLIFTAYGGVFLWTAANWGSVNIYLEVYMRATTGTVYGRLIDSNGDVLTDSEVSTASTTFQRLRSPALTLVNGGVYRNQFGKAVGDAGEFLEARIIAIPT